MLTTFTISVDTLNMDKQVIKYWAVGCGNCKAMEPTMKQLEAERPDVTFKSVNIADEPETAEKHEVASLPALVFLKDGEMVASMAGLKPKSLILKKIIEVFE